MNKASGNRGTITKDLIVIIHVTGVLEAVNTSHTYLIKFSRSISGMDISGEGGEGAKLEWKNMEHASM